MEFKGYFGMSSTTEENQSFSMSNGNGGDRFTNGSSNVATGAASSADSHDYAADPASSTFFASDLKKHGDLRNMLESNKDQLRLEAMKRIIGMVAKGRDASDLFPAVVKNVVSKNIEIKKLVYAYLVRYAEEQQDLALLSISTFQRALKDPNQLIRANALRVLSSIRVPVIVPIMMLAIKDATSDMSPYVRKTAALAIPKLYSLDDEQKDQLVEVIEKLLGDRTTLVIGSAVMAFDEVCPERTDLIHKNYRRLCQVLIDLEEWGQVTVINMLTRYARTQFVDPNEKEMDTTAGSDQENFYDDEDGEEKPKPRKATMESDHRLLLRSAKSLLQSRNSAVVMAVVQLYHHTAPKAELSVAVKPMIRLLRSHREIQSVVLSNIATLAAKPNRRSLFVPHLKTFFVRSSDPTHIKLQKLEILTSLASEGTISIILREFQAYIASSDRELIASTIQAIGRCAITISEVTETCLNGLVNLLSNRDDNVVAESVCVIRKLLQLQPTAHKDIIHHLAKLVEKISVPMAKASILWLIGEYCEQVPKIGPDVLRQAVKTFPKEENIVKLQIINLAAKLFTVNPQQTSLLVVYVFNLARYDVSYDIRDRARFLRALILPPANTGSGDDGTVSCAFSGLARQILLATKPPPMMDSKFTERAELQLGTLSHYLNTRTTGYQDLPDFPESPPPSSVRDVPVPVEEQRKTGAAAKPANKKAASPAKFYSDEDTDDEEEEEESDEEEDTDESDEVTDEEEEKTEAVKNHTKTAEKLISNADGPESEESSDEEEESDEETSSESSEEEGKNVKKSKSPPKKQVSLATISPEPRGDHKQTQPKPAVIQPSEPKPAEKPRTNDMLLDLDDGLSTPANVMTVTRPIMPMGSSPVASLKKSPSGYAVLPAVQVPSRSFGLLSAVVTGGLAISYKFTRRPFLYSAKMVAVEFTFTNNSSKTLEIIKIIRKKLPPRVEFQDFHEIATLEPNRTLHATVGIDFCDSTQNIGLVIGCGEKEYDTVLKSTVGEMLCPIAMDREAFDIVKAGLAGMNESFANIDLPADMQSRNGFSALVLDTANVAPVSGDENVDSGSSLLRFAGQTVSSSSPVLVSAVLKSPKSTVTVNCEKVLVGSMVLKEIKDAVAKILSK